MRLPLTVAQIHSAGFDATTCPKCQHIGLKPHGFERRPEWQKCEQPDPSQFNGKCGQQLDVIPRGGR